MTRYIHGTDPSEQGRLALLNRLTNRAFIDFLQVGPGDRVLEIGSGLGILAADVASSAPNVQVVGVEVSREQINAARKTPAVTYIQGDAHQLEFKDGAFDLVYARYVLEHVAEPARVLAEMRRVTRHGGRAAVLENDISLVRFDPQCPAFDNVWAAFIKYHSHIGGYPLIGRRLFRLFREAGFDHVQLSMQPENHWFGLSTFVDWIENIVGNVSGARQQLVENGFSDADSIDRGIGELRNLAVNPIASSNFSWNRAVAIR